MTDTPVHGNDMPPDPWAEEGVDLWALEKAEDLTRRNVDPDHPEWQDLDSGLRIEDFDDRSDEGDDATRRRDRLSRLPRWLACAGYALLALLVASALLLAAIR